MSITLRLEKGSPLTYQELDDNFKYLSNGGIYIPTPIVGYNFAGATADPLGSDLQIHFGANNFDFTIGNPELFLFRWRNKRTATIKDGEGNVIGMRRKRAGFIHPTTSNCGIKWAGWKFFNGSQSVSNTEITGRVTEWGIPSTIKPYEKFAIQFDRSMFRYQHSIIGQTLIAYDSNIVFDPHDQFNLSDLRNQTNTFRLRGNKINKYALAVAIDNPVATKTNGLPPKMFGTLSEPFYGLLKIAGSNGVDQFGLTKKTVSGTVLDNISSSSTARVRQKVPIMYRE